MAPTDCRACPGTRAKRSERVRIELTPLALASTLPLLTPMLSALAEIDMALTDTERAAVDQFLAHTIHAIEQVL